MATVNILYFGPIGDITGTPRETLSGLDTIPEILDSLHLKYPAINNIYYQVSLNRNLITDIHNPKSDVRYPIPADGDEIALLPPFTGG